MSELTSSSGQLLEPRAMAPRISVIRASVSLYGQTMLQDRAAEKMRSEEMRTTEHQPQMHNTPQQPARDVTNMTSRLFPCFRFPVPFILGSKGKERTYVTTMSVPRSVARSETDDRCRALNRCVLRASGPVQLLGMVWRYGCDLADC